ncbi:hypothetical protein SYNPS1DRAFT_28603 [Syncephalis pseudoplumigaleata]|uniref:Uncharacterized protein n=1 Tax=Syncephalis pseudoplumigaleata TaxID=1712513 RepID=A0A4P9YZR0_9FUNG|nr:hypothetical protein SYNPS1DRAFT_28603 [Syncephalis pseudoplumigaleata]|eukprot:RKP25673.1 hypothetical protein SYNPS1DRAFT_28603 [Syncephalis pseudoplumigaleata]
MAYTRALFAIMVICAIALASYSPAVCASSSSSDGIPLEIKSRHKKPMQKKRINGPPILDDEIRQSFPHLRKEKDGVYTSSGPYGNRDAFLKCIRDERSFKMEKEVMLTWSGMQGRKAHCYITTSTLFPSSTSYWPASLISTA